MKAYFDTSVLVAAAVADHVHHARALRWFEGIAAGDVQGVASWHGLAETWSVLTRLGAAGPLDATAARQVVDQLGAALKPQPPRATTYRQALERCAQLGVRSGAIFDALHLVTAETAGARLLLTFNVGDFERLRAETSPAILAPPDPPALWHPPAKPKRVS